MMMMEGAGFKFGLLPFPVQLPDMGDLPQTPTPTSPPTHTSGLAGGWDRQMLSVEESDSLGVGRSRTNVDY